MDFESDRFYDNLIENKGFMDYMESIFRRVYYVPDNLFLYFFNIWFGRMSLERLYKYFLIYEKKKQFQKSKKKSRK